LNAGESNFQRDFLAVGRAGEPLETSAAICEALFNVFASHNRGAFSVRLKRRRHLAWVFADNFLRALAAHDSHRRRVNFEDSLIIVENNTVA
jgi:hypothetical protein